MAFVDRVQIHVEGGRGGAGSLSFRREAHVPRGGPDGGNGGRGGQVRLVGDPTLEDLNEFRNHVHHKAGVGGAGGGRNRRGAAGEDLAVAVPLGTRVIRDGFQIAEIDVADQVVEVARGGDGGVGNRAFRSSTHRAPRETVPAGPGESAWLTLELRKPVAVAVVGLPNSGKSTLMRALTGARVVIGEYPYSTIDPAFGTMEDEAGHLYLVADVPGLDLDGAPRRGSHLEQLGRARIVLVCVDAADEEWEARRGVAEATLAGFAHPGAEVMHVVTRADLGDGGPGSAPRIDYQDAAAIDRLRGELFRRLHPA